MLIKSRNLVIGFLYAYLLKPFFFMFDPEYVHDRMTFWGKFLGKYSLTRWKIRLLFSYSNKMLEQNILGINFKNPIGLAAGFDKNAELTKILPSVGFGFEEVGSVTGFPCEGNPKPRLWRLKKSKGLLVYFGLKSEGAEIISEKLKNIRNLRKNRSYANFPIGVSIAMTNDEKNDDVEMAISDYEKAFRAFVDVGDYITVNISCPNTSGGQPFTEPEKLNLLFKKLDTIETSKPIFVKMSPDKTFAEIDEILEILKKHRVSGIICSNLTKKRDNPLIFDKNIPVTGGVSGKPVQKLSDDLLAYIYKKEGKRFILIGCGGVFSAEDAYKKIRSGATIVQMITGMIYQGPQVISEINQGLVELLNRDGFKNISEAIGADFNFK